MRSKGIELPETASQAEVEDAVDALAADPSVHGILVPAPAARRARRRGRCSPWCRPAKDVDGLTELSMGRLVRGLPGHVGCTPLGVMRLLDRYGVAIVGQASRRRRALDAGRAADGAAARPQGRRRHGDAGPFPHRRSGRRVPRGRHHHRRRRVGADDHRRPRQAGCRGRRRRGVAHRGRASSATSTSTPSRRSPGRSPRCPAAPAR